MKRLLLVINLISFLFGQDKYQFFLTNDENLKLVGENYKIIKTELDKMFADYNNKIDLGSDFYKIIYQETVYTGPLQRDLEAINRELQGYIDDGIRGVPFNNLSVYEKKYINDQVEAKHTFRPSKTVTKEKNRIIELGETLITMEAEWSDIVSYLGGYSELTNSGLSKDDISKFKVSVVLDKIELTGPSSCLAHVKIYGDEKYGFQFHKIPKSTYLYKGTYSFDYDENYHVLYAGNNLDMKFNFEKKEYLPLDKYSHRMDNDLLPSIQSYRSTIITMFEDMVPNSNKLWITSDPQLLQFKEEYISVLGDVSYYRDADLSTYSEMKSKLFRVKEELIEKERLKVLQKEIDDRKKVERDTELLCVYTSAGCVGIAYLLGYLLNG
jgi:hypothetical protein